MSSISHLFLIKLLPPLDAQAPRLASLTPAKSIVYPSRLPDGDTSPSNNFGKALQLQAGESTDFYVLRHEGVYEIVIMPLGWPGGNCSGANFTFLGDDYKTVFEALHMGYPSVPDDETLKTTDLATFIYSGNGILTREMAGSKETFDLNSPVYSAGVCVAVYQRDPAARATVLFKNSSLAMQRMGGA